MTSKVRETGLEFHGQMGFSWEWTVRVEPLRLRKPQYVPKYCVFCGCIDGLHCVLATVVQVLVGKLTNECVGAKSKEIQG